jgi:chemotaxis protein MotB
MKKIQKPKKENSERWLLTYSDLITLLMILFILLYAMSTVSDVKYEQLSSSLYNSLGQGAGILNGSNGIFPDGGSDSPVVIDPKTNQNSESSVQSTPVPTKPVSTPEPTKAPKATLTPSDEPSCGNPENIDDTSGSLSNKKDMSDFENSINEILQDMDLGVAAGTSIRESGLTISFKNDIFFDSGQDVLKKEMKKALNKIAILLNKVDNQIIIEGHTDNIPISKTNKYTSNWQLSAARAANVAQLLVEEEKVKGSRISAVGYGEFRPIASNSTAKGRSQNRRVDIIILYDDEE